MTPTTRRLAMGLMLSCMLLFASRANASMTMVWGSCPGSPDDCADIGAAEGVYEACPCDGYPSSGDTLTACQEAAYNGRSTSGYCGGQR